MRFFGRAKARHDGETDGVEDGCGKVVFVNRFYWPDSSATSQLLTDLAEHAAASGRQVLVIASRLLYADGGRVNKRRETHEGVEIHRVRTSHFNRHSLLGQLINFITFYPAAAMALLRRTRRGDVIVVKTDPPLFLVAAWLVARMRSAKVINWCQDLFPEVAMGCGVGWASGPAGAALQAVRNAVLARSDANVVVSPAMKTALGSQGLPPARINVIRNWSVGDVQPICPRENALRREWGLEDHFVLGYSGNLGRAHLEDQMRFLIGQLAADPNVKFLFIGAGYGMERLQAFCQEEGHVHVLFRPYQPRHQLSHSLSVPDIHLVSLNERCQNAMSPSKYYGVLAAGRPVALVGARHSVLAKEIEEFDLGLVLDLYERHTWRSLIEIVHHDRDRLARLSEAARRFYEQRLAPKHSLAAWIDVIARQEAAEAYGPMRASSARFS
jgi:glycosyltransferase involved in cell wall biosynthesis